MDILNSLGPESVTCLIQMTKIKASNQTEQNQAFPSCSVESSQLLYAADCKLSVDQADRPTSSTASIPSCVWLTEMSLLATARKHTNVFVLLKQMTACEGLILSHTTMNTEFQKRGQNEGK